MKKETPQEYAEMLINEYDTIIYTSFDYKEQVIRCSILCVERTIDYIDTWGDLADKDLEFFNEVLTILKNKI